jgi:hypothetical protein
MAVGQKSMGDNIRLSNMYYTSIVCAQDLYPLKDNLNVTKEEIGKSTHAETGRDRPRCR